MKLFKKSKKSDLQAKKGRGLTIAGAIIVIFLLVHAGFAVTNLVSQTNKIFGFSRSDAALSGSYNFALFDEVFPGLREELAADIAEAERRETEALLQESSIDVATSTATTSEDISTSSVDEAGNDDLE